MKSRRPDYLTVLKDPDAPQQHNLPGVAPQAPVADDASRAAALIGALEEKDQGEHQKVWDELLGGCPANVLREMNWLVFETLVRATVQYRNASGQVNKYGSVIKSPSGYPIQSPYVSIMNKQAQLIQRASADLGLTLASRLRVKAGSKPASKANPFAGLKSIED